MVAINSTIQVRIDKKTKQRAKEAFDAMGIDMSSAIKLFLTQVVLTQSIPFKIVTENGLTLEQEAEILQAADEARRGVGVVGPFNGEEAVAYLKQVANGD